MIAIRPPLIVCCVAALCAGACSREEPTASQTTVDETVATAAQSYVNDVQIGSAVGADDRIEQMTSSFAAGQPVSVAVDLQNPPAATPITVQWIGPDGQPLGYEVKAVDANQDRVSFTYDNTHDWQAGGYRVEIWVNDEKVGEQRFELSGEAQA